MTTCVQVWWGLTNTVSHHYMLTSVRTFVISSTHHWKPSTFLNTDKTSAMLLLKYYLFTKYAESICCSGWWPPSVQWWSDMLSWDWFISSDTTTLTTNHTKDWTHLSTVLPTSFLLGGEIMKIFKCIAMFACKWCSFKAGRICLQNTKQNPLDELNIVHFWGSHILEKFQRICHDIYQLRFILISWICPSWGESVSGNCLNFDEWS